MSDRVDKREAILTAALGLFAERGFHGTAVPLIADKANVGAGTIYRYFPSKEAIVNELYLKWKADLGARIMAGFPIESPAREQFHHFWQAMAVFAREQPQAFKFLEFHHHAPYLDAAAKELENQVLAPAFQFFLHTSSQKITKPLDAVLLGAIVWGAFVGLIRAAWEKRLDLDQSAIDAAEQCCWEAIRA